MARKCDCDWCNPGPFRDFKAGAVPPEYGEVEINYKPKTKVKKNKKRYPGCPGNDGGAHVFVWTTELNRRNFFYDFYGFHRTEDKVCAGCGHRDKSRKTEEYNKRNDAFKDARIRKGLRVWKWIAFEDYDDEYTTKRRAHLTRYGWDDYMFRSRWVL